MAEKYLNNTGLSYFWGKLKTILSGKQNTLTAGNTVSLNNDVISSSGIPFAQVDSTSTATAFTATVSEITSYKDGVCVLLMNGVVTSAANFTININSLGAKPAYSNLATGNDITPTDPARETTIFNINYTMLFVYSSDIVDGGGWICYRGYDSNTNTIGYQVRTNSASLPASDTGYRYRLWFTSADGTQFVPANTSTSTNATTARTLNTSAINPFAPIVYNSTNGTVTSGNRPAVTTLWQQYTLTIGYSYVLSMTAWKPVYCQCTPQNNGSAVMNTFTQTLPSSADGKIYIYLGIAYSATAMELRAEHPVFYHDGTGIKLWTGTTIPTKVSELTNDSGFITGYTETDPTVPSWAKASTKPSYTASEVGALSSSTTYVGAVKVNGTALTPDSDKAVDINQPVTNAYKIGQTVTFELFGGTSYETDLTVTSGATPNVQSDWNQTSSSKDDFIKNKPTNLSAFTNDSGFTSVSINRKTTSGTNIADITIDGTTTQLYAPTSGGGAVTSVNGQTGAVVLDADDVGALPDTTPIPSKTSDLTNDSGFITGYTETDPTVPSWAKASTKPSYTATEVGALPNTTTYVSAVKVNGTALTPDSNKAVDVTVPTAIATIDGVAQGVIGHETTYDTNFINWEDSAGNIVNFSVDPGDVKLAINQYDATEDDWTTVGSLKLNNIYSTDNKPTVTELKDSTRKYLSSAGTTTITLTSAKTYLVVITKFNNGTVNNSGLYIVQCHTTSSVRAIASSAVATVSISGTTLTITTSSTNVDIECIRLTP